MTTATTLLLEHADQACSMPERLVNAAARIMTVGDCGEVDTSTHTLRDKQIGVFTDFSNFLEEVATDPELLNGPYPSGRIILPPRTGKTIIAGQIIAASGMMTTFIVPTKTLVRQTVIELRQQLPGVPVGIFFGEKKAPVWWGVNVTTYSSLHRHFAKHGVLPAEIALSSLIFADEAHHSMTANRQAFLADGFDSAAVRVALTATANYDHKRRLSKYFRTLIHQISISEAIDLEMVAPVRVWIAEVNVDGSSITLHSGDYNESELGEVMSSAPFMEAARQFRYNSSQRDKSALICCRTRQQAHSVYCYFRDHRPKDTLAPAILLGDTPRKERERILQGDKDGTIDTIINVGVLIEGWSSQKCKLLIDLAPSCSWVRATQKFFRPMTKWGEKEASIFMLVPKDMPVFPVIPMDLFEWNMPTFEAGGLISSKSYGSSDKAKLSSTAVRAIQQVSVSSKILMNRLFEKPELDPNNNEQIRRVLDNHPDLDQGEIPLFGEFRKLVFNHELFVGRGANLLRYCRVRLTRPEYVLFMARFFDKAASDLYIRSGYNATGKNIFKKTKEEDHLVFMGSPYGDEEEETPEWGELFPSLQVMEPQIQDCSTVELNEKIAEVLDTLTVREREIIKLKLGLADGHTYTLKEIGKIFNLTSSRIRQIFWRGIHKLRHPTRRILWKSFWEPPS